MELNHSNIIIIMFSIVNFMLLFHIPGIIGRTDDLLYLPNVKVDEMKNEGPLKNDERYCYKLTWLGNKYCKATFPVVMNKSCSEHFIDDDRLCIDPMAVTFSGKEPDFTYVKNFYPSEATCRLLDDQACVKYTIYYNGKPSYVVRYCTRIDIEEEGPMRSGCLLQKKGSSVHEICACISGKGPDGICNGSGRIFFDSNNTFFSPVLITIIIKIIIVKFLD